MHARRQRKKGKGKKGGISQNVSDVTRAFPRDFIPERRLINIHTYNLFMSSIFIVKLI